MIGDITVADEIYIVCGYTDMRKSIDGLCAIVQDKLHMDPRSSAIFLRLLDVSFGAEDVFPFEEDVSDFKGEEDFSSSGIEVMSGGFTGIFFSSLFCKQAHILSAVNSSYWKRLKRQIKGQIPCKIQKEYTTLHYILR